MNATAASDFIRSHPHVHTGHIIIGRVLAATHPPSATEFANEIISRPPEAPACGPEPAIHGASGSVEQTVLQGIVAFHAGRSTWPPWQSTRFASRGGRRTPVSPTPCQAETMAEPVFTLVGARSPKHITADERTGSSRAVRTDAPSRRIGDAPEHGVGTVRWWWRSSGSGVDESTQREAAGDDAAPQKAIRPQLAVRFRDGMSEQAEGPGRARARQGAARARCSAAYSGDSDHPLRRESDQRFRGKRSVRPWRLERTVSMDRGSLTPGSSVCRNSGNWVGQRRLNGRP